LSCLYLVKIILSVLNIAAAVRSKYTDIAENQIAGKLGAFLAQSSDRDGGRKDRDARKSFIS